LKRGQASTGENSPEPASEAPTSVSADFDSRGIARYHQLAALFRNQIETGAWAVGTQIPTVIELAQSYGVARETVRHALGMLVDDGLIRRYRAKGTFVIATPRHQVWCQLETNFLGLLQAREGAQIELLSEDRDAGIGGMIECGVPEGTYRKLRRRHWRDDEPYMIAEVFISERWAEKIPRASFSTKTALKLVADIEGLAITDVEQILTISVADLDASKSLRIPLNAPVAQIERYATDKGGHLVLFARNIYRGDVVRLNIKSK
jgi:GntR family transcriptional regulator